MKWYKAHVNLKGHPKRYRFEGVLGTGQGLHYIHLWFAYIAEYAQSGDVTHLTHAEIAKACEWAGDPEVFWQALSVGGFVEVVKGGKQGSRTIAHDWFEENARFIKENENRKPTGNPRVTHGKPVLQDKTRQEKEPSLGKPKAVIPNKELMEVFCTAWALQAKGTKYFVTPRDGQRLKLLLKAGLELDRWRLAVPAYLNSTDQWIKSQGFPLWALCDNFNLYGAAQPTTTIRRNVL